MPGEDAHLEMAYEDRFDISHRWYAEDSHLEMAFEDSVAHPLVGSQEYNDSWVDASYDEHQEFAYEASLEEFEEDDE